MTVSETEMISSEIDAGADIDAVSVIYSEDAATEMTSLTGMSGSTEIS